MKLYLFSGPSAVSTREAIQAFNQWKSREPGLAGQLVEESNENIKAFLRARGARAAAAALGKARATGIALGDAIGVEARIPVPAGVDPELCKSVGAGNELGVYVRLPGAPEPPGQSGATGVTVADGFSWQRS